MGVAAAMLVIAVRPASAGPRVPAAGPANARVSHLVATLPTWGYVLHVDRYHQSYPEITAVSCVSPSFCATVDNDGNVLLFKGRSWSRPTNIDTNTYGLSSVSCATAKFCWAIDADGYGRRWNGSHWLPATSIDPMIVSPPYPAISCPTVSFCALVDQYGKGAIWNGTKWRKTTVGQGGDEQAVSCVSSAFCVAGDLSGTVYIWNGKKWSAPRNVDPGGTVRAVSCVKGPFCVAVGADAETLKGTTWTSHGPIAPVDLDSAACVSAGFCVVGDGVGDAYRWSNGSFSSQGMIDPDDSLSGLSCPSTSFCSAVDSNGNALFFAPPPLITTLKLPPATKSHRYVVSLTAEGALVGPGAWHVVAGSFPDGLKLSVAGEISGTPKSTGTFRFIVRVTDPLGQHSQRHFEIKVKS